MFYAASVIQVMAVNAVLLLCGAVAFLFADPRVYFDIAKIDWTAIGAVATALSAAFTAWAAWAATKAARAAISVDQNQAYREQARINQRALAMSVGLEHELVLLCKLTRAISRVPGSADLPGNALQIAEYAKTVYEGSEMILIPLMERFADHFSDFDSLTAGRLTKVLSGVLQMRRAVPKGQMPLNIAVAFIDATRSHARAVRREAIIARKSMQPYTKQILRRRREKT